MKFFTCFFIQIRSDVKLTSIKFDNFFLYQLLVQQFEKMLVPYVPFVSHVLYSKCKNQLT